MDLVWQIQHLWVFQITTPVSHSSDLSDPSLKSVASGMKCGIHWEGMFHRDEGLQGNVWKWKKSHDGLHFSGCQMQLGRQPACLEKASFHILMTKFFFLFFFLWWILKFLKLFLLKRTVTQQSLFYMHISLSPTNQGKCKIGDSTEKLKSWPEQFWKSVSLFKHCFIRFRLLLLFSAIRGPG